MAELPKRPTRSDEIYYGGLGVGEEPSPVGGLAVLIGLGMVITLALLALPLLEAIIQDPKVRWGFLVVVLGVCALALLWVVYPKAGQRSFQMPPERAERPSNATEREAEMVSRALDGAPYSQLLALLELREMAVRRFMLRRHLSRAEAEALLGDPLTAGSLLMDQDLAWLVGADHKGAYEPECLAADEGKARVSSFGSRFPILLRKVEEMR